MRCLKFKVIVNQEAIEEVAKLGHGYGHHNVRHTLIELWEVGGRKALTVKTGFGDEYRDQTIKWDGNTGKKLEEGEVYPIYDEDEQEKVLKGWGLDMDLEPLEEGEDFSDGPGFSK